MTIALRLGGIAAAAALGLTACVGGTDTASTSSSQDTAGLPQAIKDAGSLRVGLSPDFPPMEYRDGDKLVGADIELQQKLGEVLGVKIETVESPFDQLINSVQTGRVDMAMSGISDTVERQKTVDFIDYFNSQGRVYTSGARAAEFTKQSDICGKNVAVSGKSDYLGQLKTLSQSLCTDKNLPAINLLSSDSGAAARLQIDQGRADLAAQSAENLAYFAKTEPGKYQPVLDPLPARAFGALVKKGDTQLSNAIKAAFDKIIADGDYQKILDKYGLGYGATTPVINGVKS
ncbi:ABC transporter substrate-binding protein [Pseudarthrobacter sp. AG30]|uniref:ABC transporter substrate-binding protein n=1 Tax=Pseudarthrobacter sp. AG30 TaxID=2249742 RepID=UPI001402AA37|nr:ABC transporter substrate-binding protein [Pseudarthrobacter sp. AG30]